MHVCYLMLIEVLDSTTSSIYSSSHLLFVWLKCFSSSMFCLVISNLGLKNCILIPKGLFESFKLVIHLSVSALNRLV